MRVAKRRKLFEATISLEWREIGMSTGQTNCHRFDEQATNENTVQQTRQPSTQHSCGRALDYKIEEIVALTIAVIAGYEGAISFHTYNAIHAGACAEEISDILNIITLMGARVDGLCQALVNKAIQEAQIS